MRLLIFYCLYFDAFCVRMYVFPEYAYVVRTIKELCLECSDAIIRSSHCWFKK